MPRVVCDDYSIEGFSRSTIETYFHIKELKLVFDIGKCPFHITPVPNVFLSHMHGDHAMGIYYYISHRNLAKMVPGKIYLPEEALADTEKAISAFSSLEFTRRNYELVPLTIGQEIPYGREHVIKTFETDHRIPSLGYHILHKKEKLKPEFIGKDPKEIIELKKKGEKITNTLFEPVITYLGDSTIKAVDENPFVKESKILIMECTFLDPDHFDQAELRKHIHIQNIIDRADEFKNQFIILSHFSMRYTEEKIRELIVNSKLPDDLKKRIIIFV